MATAPVWFSTKKLVKLKFHQSIKKTFEALANSHFKLPLCFPRIIREAENRALGPGSLDNGFDCRFLLFWAWDRRSVRQARARPAGLEIIADEARADGFHGAEGVGYEVACLGGGGGVVEEWMDVGGDDVEGGTQQVRVLGEDVDGFGGGDGACEAGFSQARSGLRDELREVLGAAVFVEDGLVADDDHLDIIPLSCGPGGDFADLGLPVRKAVFGNKDSEHELEVMGFRRRSDVLETRAVRAIETNRTEAI